MDRIALTTAVCCAALLTACVKKPQGPDGTDEISLTPIVHITYPEDGAVYAVGDEVLFSCSAVAVGSPGDGVDVSWSSDKDGVLSSGGWLDDGAAQFLTSTLSYNRHVVTVTVTGIDGSKGTDRVTVYTNAPVPVALLSVAADTSAATLIWQRSDISDFDAYLVYRATTYSGTGVVVGTLDGVNDTAFTDTSITWAGTYYYWVCVRNASQGVSEGSNILYTYVPVSGDGSGYGPFTFESGTLEAVWTTGGDASWYVTSGNSYGGSYCAVSGDIGNSEESYLTMTLYFSGSGSISFYRSVSSESGYDYLRFYIDSSLQEYWAGSYSWSREQYSFASGTHTFMWTYSKDGSASSGSDCGWIDDIEFTLY